MLLAWSGGKDSTMALAAMRADPGFEVVGLLTTVTADYDRVSMHGIRRSILEAQAVRLGLPVFQAVVAAASSNSAYDAAWGDALERARRELGPVEHVAYGDLFLEDVREYRELQAKALGYTPLLPLWGRDTTELARDFVAAGHEAWLTCVDTTQLSAEFAGRRFDRALLEDLPASVDPCGERGEFHTCLTGGPCLESRIAVVRGERVLRDGRFEYCDFQLAAEPATLHAN